MALFCHIFVILRKAEFVVVDSVIDDPFSSDRLRFAVASLI
jgi:hypothetical protein